ncbi:chromatin protein Cren7 [Pyrobaculum aerophilum]|uniref:Chromatin protein Cren7 n=1 Tax=Pyrobaculum aerophilum TaxID=13773 RepID=A0A371QVZ1_9CREN|nr:chromatin protein Cren7 [Pyrobaculum aerophilum]RFA94334.1 chorismate-binding protein [Pyrobaculum aerophilum]RFB00296.1 chorismate-binding protein [Pyrobaculum aerophilum]
MAEEILNREYEVEYEGRRYFLRPVKAWVLQPPGKPGVVVALFKLPNGKSIRKVIMRLPP